MSRELNAVCTDLDIETYDPWEVGSWGVVSPRTSETTGGDDQRCPPVRARFIRIHYSEVVLPGSVAVRAALFRLGLFGLFERT